MEMQEKENVKNKRGMKNEAYTAKPTIDKILGLKKRGNNRFIIEDEDYSDLYKYNEKIDTPFKVIDTYFNNDNELYFKLQFKERRNGLIPDDKILSASYLKKNHPDFLIDFYESVIKKSLKKN